MFQFQVDRGHEAFAAVPETEKALVHSLIHEIVNDTEAFIAKVQYSDSVLNNIIEPFPDLDYLKQFATSYYWTGEKIVNVFEVIGTADPDYIGATWIAMLRLGKRMHSVNLPLLQENPGYYFDISEKSPEMYYTRINDRLYISGEGNHRTSIAFPGERDFAKPVQEGL